MVFRLKRKEFEINCVTRRGMFLHSIIGCECWNHSKILPTERLKNRFQMNDSIISYAYWIDSKCYSTDALCPIRLDKFIVFIMLCLNRGASLFVINVKFELIEFKYQRHQFTFLSLRKLEKTIFNTMDGFFTHLNYFQRISMHFLKKKTNCFDLSS